MRPAPIFAVLGLLWASEGHAHCYSIWHYPRPQHCGVRLAVVAARQLRPGPAQVSYSPAPAAAPIDEDRSWYVEIVVTPQLMESLARDEAVEELRKQVGGGQ